MWNVEGGRKAQGIEMTGGQCIDLEKKGTDCHISDKSKY